MTFTSNTTPTLDRPSPRSLRSDDYDLRALNALNPESRRDIYFEIAERLRFPLWFMPSNPPSFLGNPFRTLVHELASHDKFAGGKISTLDEPHFLYWASMSRDLGLNFLPRVATILGSHAIRMGLPLLIGAGVSACPLICAKKYWRKADFDSRVYKLFKPSSLWRIRSFVWTKRAAPRVQASTAEILRMLGVIDTAEIHPDCPDLRIGDEQTRMRELCCVPCESQSAHTLLFLRLMTLNLLRIFPVFVFTPSPRKVGNWRKRSIDMARLSFRNHRLAAMARGRNPAEAGQRIRAAGIEVVSQREAFIRGWRKIGKNRSRIKTGH